MPNGLSVRTHTYLMSRNCILDILEITGIIGRDTGNERHSK